MSFNVLLYKALSSEKNLDTPSKLTWFLNIFRRFWAWLYQNHLVQVDISFLGNFQKFINFQVTGRSTNTTPKNDDFLPCQAGKNDSPRTKWTKALCTVASLKGRPMKRLMSKMRAEDWRFLGFNHWSTWRLKFGKKLARFHVPRDPGSQWFHGT